MKDRQTDEKQSMNNLRTEEKDKKIKVKKQNESVKCN